MADTNEYFAGQDYLTWLAQGSLTSDYRPFTRQQVCSDLANIQLA
jgi:hypothetical protein